jgi:hypothetical protein
MFLEGCRTRLMPCSAQTYGDQARYRLVFLTDRIAVENSFVSVN